MSDEQTWKRADLPAALNTALEAALERGARAPTVLRMTEIAGYTDWALLVSARSERQVRGIIENIKGKLSGGQSKLIGSDGLDVYLWALLDYDDFLVHVFYHPVRKHYDLESMWSDAPRVELDLPPELVEDEELASLAAPDPMPNYRGDLAFGGFEDEFEDDEDDEGDEGADPEFVDDDLFGDDTLDGTSAPEPAANQGPVNEDDDLFDD